MMARRIREAVSCNTARICMDSVAEHFGIMWAVADLPRPFHAMCVPDRNLVLVHRKLRGPARRFYLCHEIVECLNPISLVHGSHYNEVAGHVLVPPWLVPDVVNRSSNVEEVARIFDAPRSVVRYQLSFVRQERRG